MNESLQIWLGGGVMLVGALFCIIGAFGLLRLPDVFARMHAASLVDTLGMLLLVLGMLIIEGLFTQNTLRLLLIALFVLFTSPVATHALSKAALKEGVKPVLADESDDDVTGGDESK